MKSRTEIALIRLLDKCQEMANDSEDIATEWRLPKFISSCEEMLTNLLKTSDSNAPSQDSITQYQNKIMFLKSLLPPPEDDHHEQEHPNSLQQTVPMPLPQGSTFARDTVSKQIYQKMAERHNLSSRDQLLGNNNKQDGFRGAGVSLDKLLSDQRDQQEKIAEEMIMLTRSLKEQSSIAGSIIRKDTLKLEATSAQADSNFEKLSVETKRVGEFSARGNCRCWIWLMMVVVVATFIGMVLMMRLFSKKLPASTPSTVEYESVTQSRNRVDEL